MRRARALRSERTRRSDAHTRRKRRIGEAAAGWQRPWIGRPALRYHVYPVARPNQIGAASFSAGPTLRIGVHPIFHMNPDRHGW